MLHESRCAGMLSQSKRGRNAPFKRIDRSAFRIFNRLLPKVMWCPALTYHAQTLLHISRAGGGSVVASRGGAFQRAPGVDGVQGARAGARTYLSSEMGCHRTSLFLPFSPATATRSAISFSHKACEFVTWARTRWLVRGYVLAESFHLVDAVAVSELEVTGSPLGL